jgi:hypothetical protein
MPQQRIADLVIVGPDNKVRGCLLPFPVETPWWNDVEAVVEAAWRYYGVNVTILRLIYAEGDSWHNGGRVTYLAEGALDAELQPWFGSLAEHPLRRSYARSGGPVSDLNWAKLFKGEWVFYNPAGCSGAQLAPIQFVADSSRWPDVMAEGGAFLLRS